MDVIGKNINIMYISIHPYVYPSKAVVLNLCNMCHWWYFRPPLVVLRGVSPLYFNIMVVLGETDIF